MGFAGAPQPLMYEEAPMYEEEMPQLELPASRVHKDLRQK
jgi:hypothetical protein